MKATPPEELFPVVDEEGNQIGTAPRSVCHDGKSKLLHPVIHLHLFNRKGELFLQKRSIAKDLLPGYWDSSVGGHISPGENTEEALLRETREELGLIDFSYEFIRKYIWESPRERELVYSFRGVTDKTPVINTDEIEEGRFWNKKELAENLGESIFTPNLEYELRMLIIID